MRGKSRESSFITHQVKIRIEGFRIDKLINLAVKAKIPIRNLRHISDTETTCYIYPEDLSKLRKLSKSLYRITVIKNEGICYQIKSVIFDKTRLLCILTVLAMVLLNSFFVRTVEIEGYKGIPEKELRQCLEEAGIRAGTYIPSIDWQKAEKLIYDTFPEVVWLKIGYDGRKVVLTISEGEVSEKAKEMPENYYCNIVAAESGYIDSIETYRGIALVQKGDYVEKGQVLILGCVPANSTSFSEDAPKEYYVRSKGIVNALVPCRFTYSYEVQGEVSQKQMEKNANQQIRLWARENLPEKSQIVNKDLKFSRKENIIEVGVTLEIRRQIGEEQEILVG